MNTLFLSSFVCKQTCSPDRWFWCILGLASHLPFASRQRVPRQAVMAAVCWVGKWVANLTKPAVGFFHCCFYYLQGQSFSYATVPNDIQSKDGWMPWFTQRCGAELRPGLVVIFLVHTVHGCCSVLPLLADIQNFLDLTSVISESSMALLIFDEPC